MGTGVTETKDARAARDDPGLELDRDGDAGDGVVAPSSRGLGEGRAGPGGEPPEAHGLDELVVVQRRLERALEEVGRADLASPPGADRLDDGSGEHGDGRHLAGGVGVGDGPDGRAAVADRGVGHVAQRLPEQGQGGARPLVPLELGVAHQGADPDPRVGDVHGIQARRRR